MQGLHLLCIMHTAVHLLRLNLIHIADQDQQLNSVAAFKERRQLNEDEQHRLSVHSLH